MLGSFSGYTGLLRNLLRSSVLPLAVSSGGTTATERQGMAILCFAIPMGLRWTPIWCPKRLSGWQRNLVWESSGFTTCATLTPS